MKELWKKRQMLVERALREELTKTPILDDTLRASMEYSLMAGGKRLRPILLMAAADAVGADGTKFLPVACALEMIHTYSLIHDDLPAMDNDDLRRGKPTNHVVYGDGIAILAGDALLTLAFTVILRQKDVAAEALLRVADEISRAAGAEGMVGGQVLDLEAENRQITMEELRRVHMGKTGALFHAALRSGAILAGASEEQLAALTLYADHFGLAFQITDDILDVIGTAEDIGKPVGSDEKNHKSTYVSLTSLAEAQELARRTAAEAEAALRIFGDEASFLRDLVAYLVNRKQ
ncbi:MAG: polyprenyl synthetase family protein [Centipeda sp. (in: firmicutes)]|uniref:polyprenyl synthetase family protein n=1 Tax=Selenomonas sp. oral taxon 920 TaxID=1884263 RepID=UPI000840CFCA|nr:farnesyl diphosphate synthase [Selenomonas sp. oral taxon 920]AOH48202.1 geranyl transferase [Selenomonas sp. oral taxon 920]